MTENVGGFGAEGGFNPMRGFIKSHFLCRKQHGRNEHAFASRGVLPQSARKIGVCAGGPGYLHKLWEIDTHNESMRRAGGAKSLRHNAVAHGIYAAFNELNIVELSHGEMGFCGPKLVKGGEMCKGLHNWCKDDTFAYLIEHI